MSIKVPKEVWRQILQYSSRDLELPRFITVRDFSEKFNENSRALIDTTMISSIEVDDIYEAIESPSSEAFFTLKLKGRKDSLYIGKDHNPRLYAKLVKIVKSFDLEEMNDK